MKPKSEFEKFDEFVTRILAVPHSEIRTKMKEWKRRRKRKKRAKRS